MGEILGEIVKSVVSGVMDSATKAIDRKSIAKALRDTAGKIERKEIVPDAMLARAKKLAADIAAVRDQYRDG